MSKYFGDIVIQSKDDKRDFRAFLHCQDNEGEWWELRGYGETPGKAADEVWDHYQRPEEEWDIFGYVTPAPKEE